MVDRYEYPIESNNYFTVPPDTPTNVSSGTRLFLSGGSILDMPADSSILTEIGFLPEDDLVGQTIISNKEVYTSSFTPIADHLSATSLSTMQVNRYTVLSTEAITDTQITLSQVPTEPTNRLTIALDEYVQVLLAPPDDFGENFILSVSQSETDTAIAPSIATLELDGNTSTLT